MAFLECYLIAFSIMKLIQGPIIKTRFLGPTNSRGSRYVAEHKRDSTTKWRRIISKHYGSSEWENHRNAAQELIENSPMNEWGIMIVCAGYDSDGYYWIVADAPINLKSLDVVNTPA